MGDRPTKNNIKDSWSLGPELLTNDDGPETVLQKVETARRKDQNSGSQRLLVKGEIGQEATGLE
jgi:hypothetical protein